MYDIMQAKRKRPTYTFTLDPSPMTHIEEFARVNGVSMSFCIRQAVRNYARSLRQKTRAARAVLRRQDARSFPVPPPPLRLRKRPALPEMP